MQYKIDDALVNEILSYLGTQPYISVFKIIEGMKSISKIEEIKETPQNEPI